MAWKYDDDQITFEKKPKVRLKKPRNSTVFFPFTKDIPWYCRGICILQTMLPQKWEAITKNKNIVIFTPGYFIEVLASTILYKICYESDMNVKILCPAYYNKLLDLYKIPGYPNPEIKNPLDEFERMKEVILEYPAPLFFDYDDNLYINSLFHYGKFIDSQGNETKTLNEDSFFVQICNNICATYIPSLMQIRNVHITRLFEEFCLKTGSTINNVVLLDNTTKMITFANKLKGVRKFYFDQDIKAISNMINKNSVLFVMENEPSKRYINSNVFFINPWYEIESDVVAALLSHAKVVISSDPNIYLSTALLKGGNIYVNDKPKTGFKLEDCIKLEALKKFKYGKGSLKELAKFFEDIK